MTEEDLMAVPDRRARLERALRAEGVPEAMIDRLATDETAAKLLVYEKQAFQRIFGRGI